MNINKKGFTLVELLAVIVILAVLILLALPAVLRTMERARDRAFITEANTIIRAAETARAEHEMTATFLDCYQLTGHTDPRRNLVPEHLTSTSRQGRVVFSNAGQTVTVSVHNGLTGSRARWIMGTKEDIGAEGFVPATSAPTGFSLNCT